MRSSVVYVLMIWCLSLCWAKGPPFLTEPDYNPRKIERVGRTIRLKCPVEGNPEPFMRWSKDGQDINENAWERFKILENTLRIRDSMEQDTGIYLCHAVNGFGHEVVNYTLIVLKENATIPRHFANGPGDKGGIPPRFSEPTKMRQRNIQRPTGSSVRLRCKAFGKPRPNVIWLKDGRPITGVNVEHNTKKRPPWILKLRNLQVQNSGKYVCRVYNRAGAINFTYSLEVIGKTRLKPEFLTSHPMNTTVQYGNKATFVCKVKSDVEPHIQWLKRIVDPEELKKYANSTISVNDQKFVVLKMSRAWGSPESTFINKLTIDHVTEKHAGMYICLVTSQLGYSFRSAYLTVTQLDNTLDRQVPGGPGIGRNMSDGRQALDFNVDVSPPYLIIYIIVPLCVLALLILLVVFCCLKNKNKNTRTPQQHMYNGQRVIDKESTVPLNQPQYSQNSKERMYRNMTLESQPGYVNGSARMYRPDLRGQNIYSEPVIHSDAHSDVSTRVHSDLQSELSSVHTRDPLSDMYSEVSSIPTMHHNGMSMSDMYCEGPGLPRVHHNPMDLHATLLARLQQQNRMTSNHRTPTPSESSSVSRIPHSTHYGIS